MPSRSRFVVPVFLLASLFAVALVGSTDAVASPRAAAGASRLSAPLRLGSLSSHRRAVGVVTPKGRTRSTAHVAIAPSWQDQKRVCVMNQLSIAGVSTFASMVGRQTIDCAMVYNAPPTWATWASPWFVDGNNPDQNWAAWVRDSPANDRRQLIITQPLIPSGINGTDWRMQGAAGAFVGYAKLFAQHLVAAGLGDAIIRLAPEMNGTWNFDSLGSTPADFANWVAFWRQTVLAMKSVPGENFKFDWCVNNRYRNIPFNEYYPGDDVVDIIGSDFYDSGVPAGQDRWNFIYNSGGSLSSLISFAQSHGKPLSFPEWGVGVPNSGNLAGGDDPTYVANLAHVIASNQVAYQSYFYAHEWYTQLNTGPLSLAAYRSAFGDGGTAVGADDGTDGTAASATPANVSPVPGVSASPSSSASAGPVSSNPSRSSTVVSASSPAKAATTGPGAGSPTAARSSSVGTSAVTPTTTTPSGTKAAAAAQTPKAPVRTTAAHTSTSSRPSKSSTASGATKATRARASRQRAHQARITRLRAACLSRAARSHVVWRGGHCVVRGAARRA